MSGAAEAAAAVESDEVAAAEVFGDRLLQAQRYAELLQTVAIERGLLGPREAGRVWSRHLLSSAAAARLLPDAARVVDVGSGAGLPGIPLALVRPDVAMTLLEPMARRASFLSDVVAELGLDVDVVRGRAEDARRRYDVVVARAVAPLSRLLGFTVPLLNGPGTALLAFKGRGAADEITQATALLRTLHAEALVHEVGRGGWSTHVVEVRLTRAAAGRRLPHGPRGEDRSR